MMKSLQGYFLVASPHLHDGNFFRSVVLMVQHDEAGAIGLILNRPTDRTVTITDDLDVPINIGGPVGGPMMALHTVAKWPENEVINGVYLASHNSLDRVMADGTGPVLVFSGYSGWGEGQLEGELEDGGWLTSKATRDDVFSDPDELWRRISDGIGRDILGRKVARNRPDDATLN